jgi:ABC-type phosphate/phosphonate transport system substrate-binding protein
MNAQLGAIALRSAWLMAIGIACGVTPILAQAAGYTLVVEPHYRPERAQEAYKPLTDYLSKSTGETFTLVTPKNYHFYWRDIRSNAKADFAFDEAHLTDYRIKHYKYQVLVHTAEPSAYTLVTNVDIGKKGLNALIGHNIASMGAPSLGYALLLQLYPNPVQQPEIQSSASSWLEAVDSVFAGEAEAAMAPTAMIANYPNLTQVKSTREFPGQAFSAASGVPDEVKQKVKEALLKLNDDPSLFALLSELQITKFVPATAKEYDGAELMLKDFYGYQ